MTELQIDTGSILLGIIIVLTAATLGEAGAKRLGLPQVMGELSMGILLGNLGLFCGCQFFNFVREMPFIKVLGDMGAIVLLLSVGVQTDLRAMVTVGLSSFLVATVGIIAPAGLGLWACQLLIPEASTYTKLFLVAPLCVSSAGVTIRVFVESGKLDTPEARIVIAATLLDAVFIFVVMGVLSGIVQAGQFCTTDVIKAGGRAGLFLLLVGMVGIRYGQGLGDFATKKFPESLKVIIAVIACLFMAHLAGTIGMPPIVGAFGAGLLVRDIRARDPGGVEWNMEDLLRPTYLTLVPVFFVFLGAHVRLESFLDVEAVWIGLAITVAAVLGKFVACLGVREGGINRLLVGAGMLPRAEMALIVASMGVTVKVLNHSAYSAIIIMVVLTSLLGLPLLKRLLYSP
jgi:Kef-type K+ transport system membrane component KefB